VISKLDYKDGYVKDVSISRDGVIVSNELIKKTVKKEGYEIVNSVEIGTDRFAFKILKKPCSILMKLIRGFAKIPQTEINILFSW
jgi:hypothetical protein